METEKFAAGFEKYLMVLNLPMRNGNTNRENSGHKCLVVLNLPMRNGNGRSFFPSLLRGESLKSSYEEWKPGEKRAQMSLVYAVLNLPMRNGNQRVHRVDSTQGLGLKSSYEEWKQFRDSVLDDYGRVLNLPMRNGNCRRM